MSDEPTGPLPPSRQVKTPPPKFLLGCAGVSVFFVTWVGLGIMMMSAPVATFCVYLLAIGALFAARRSGGLSPLMGAVAVGAAVALVPLGICLLIVTTSR